MNHQKNNEPDLNELLDKMIKLQEGNKSPSCLRKTIYVVTSICVIMFVALMCYSLYKNNLSTESILATFLAFFSIFMSVFFYFKADETSTKFYDSSYKFMKDISVTLGKIEERFGEKLNSLNDKMSHIDKEKNAISNEIRDKEEDKDKIINELIEKTNLNKEEKEKYRKEIQARDEEIEKLRRNKFQAEREASRLRRKMNGSNTLYIDDEIEMLSQRTLMRLLQNQDTSDLTIRNKQELRKYGLIDSDGGINEERIIECLNNNRRNV